MMLTVVSGLCALLVFVALVRPTTFAVLINKGANMPSLGKQGQFTALVTSTWVLVYITTADKLTEWYAGLYMLAWAGAQFGSIWLQVKGQAGTTTTTSTSDRTTTTKEAP